MKKHEKEVIQSQLDAEKAVLEQLKKNYEQAIKDIDEKVAALLGRQDADMQHVIYQVEYQRQLRTQAQSILEQLQANEFETISEYLAQCYEEGFMGSLYSMQQQGVPLAFPINQEQVVMALQTDSKISEGLYTRLGKDVGELKKNISAEIARGISTSMPYAQIAKNINRQAEIGLNRAMRITRTEGGRIQNKAAMDAMYKAKEMGADVVKRWSAALDARTRDSHARIDGEIREVEEKFSNGMMYPKDPSGKASEVVNCRCKVQEKARWALTANQTKMLGDTSKMTESQKEAIADRLGIPVKDLDKYSGQVVPINAKSYDDFKKQYKGIWNYEGSDLQKKAEKQIASYKKKNAVSEGVAKAGRVEANGRFVNNKEKLYRYAAKVRPIDGFEDFTCHADPDGFYIDMKGEEKEEDFIWLSPKEYAEVIRNSNTYKGGNIRILSCQSGALEDGAAKQLAEELQVVVLAPTEIVNFDENGEMFLTDNDILAEMWYYASKEERAKMKETGKWIEFKPSER